MSTLNLPQQAAGKQSGDGRRSVLNHLQQDETLETYHAWGSKSAKAVAIRATEPCIPCRTSL